MVIAIKKSPRLSGSTSQVFSSIIIDDFVIEEMDLLPPHLSQTPTATPSSSGPLPSATKRTTTVSKKAGLAYPVGTKVAYKFDDGKYYAGEVSDFSSNRYSILYDDGDKEKCTEKEVRSGAKVWESRFGSAKKVKPRPKAPSTSSPSSLPFSVSACPYLHTTPTLPAAHLPYLGNRYNCAWRGKDTYPVLVFHPGCLQPSNAVYKLWQKMSFESDEGAALVLLWYRGGGAVRLSSPSWSTKTSQTGRRRDAS